MTGETAGLSVWTWHNVRSYLFMDMRQNRLNVRRPLMSKARRCFLNTPDIIPTCSNIFCSVWKLKVLQHVRPHRRFVPPLQHHPQERFWNYRSTLPHTLMTELQAPVCPIQTRSHGCVLVPTEWDVYVYVGSRSLSTELVSFWGNENTTTRPDLNPTHWSSKYVPYVGLSIWTLIDWITQYQVGSNLLQSDHTCIWSFMVLLEANQCVLWFNVTCHWPTKPKQSGAMKTSAVVSVPTRHRSVRKFGDDLGNLKLPFT